MGVLWCCGLFVRVLYVGFRAFADLSKHYAYLCYRSRVNRTANIQNVICTDIDDMSLMAAFTGSTSWMVQG